jgi:hypothetical protein
MFRDLLSKDSILHKSRREHCLKKFLSNRFDNMDPLYLNYKVFDYDDNDKASKLYHKRLARGSTTPRLDNQVTYYLVVKNFDQSCDSLLDYFQRYVLKKRFVCSMIRRDEYGTEWFVSAPNYHIFNYNYFSTDAELVDYFSVYDFIKDFK